MLVPQTNRFPQPAPQQLCPRCGRLPAFSTSICPSCGLSFPVPWPSQSYGPSPSVPFSFGVLPPQPSFTPLIVELLLNVIGIYGIGWLMLGDVARGLLMLIGSLVWCALVFLLSIFTLGLGLVCLAPIAIVAMVVNAVLLQQAIKRNAC